MATHESQTAVEATFHQLIAAISKQLDQASICATAASKLAGRGNTEAALKALMDVEPPAHDALDLFRAVMAIRSHLMSFPDPKSR